MTTETESAGSALPVIPKPQQLMRLTPEQLATLPQKLSSRLLPSTDAVLNKDELKELKDKERSYRTKILAQERKGLFSKPRVDSKDPDELWIAVHVLYPDRQAAKRAFVIVRSAQIIALAQETNQVAKIPADISAEDLHERFIRHSNGKIFPILDWFNKQQIFYGDRATLTLLNDLTSSEPAVLMATANEEAAKAVTAEPAAETAKPVIFEVIEAASPAQAEPAEILTQRVRNKIPPLVQNLRNQFPSGYETYANTAEAATVRKLNIIVSCLDRSDFSQVLQSALVIAGQSDLAQPASPLEGQILDFLQALSEMPQVRTEIDQIYAQAAQERKVPKLAEGYWLVVDGLACTTMWGNADDIPSRYNLKKVLNRTEMIGGWNGNDGKITVVRQDGCICIGFGNFEGNVDAVRKAEDSQAEYCYRFRPEMPTYLSEGTNPTDWDARSQYDDFRARMEGITEADDIADIRRRFHHPGVNPFAYRGQLSEEYCFYHLAKKIGANKLNKEELQVIMQAEPAGTPWFIAFLLGAEGPEDRELLIEIFSQQPPELQQAFQVYLEVRNSGRFEQENTYYVDFNNRLCRQLGVTEFSELIKLQNSLLKPADRFHTIVGDSQFATEDLRQALNEYTKATVQYYRVHNEISKAYLKFFNEALARHHPPLELVYGPLQTMDFPWSFQKIAEPAAIEPIEIAAPKAATEPTDIASLVERIKTGGPIPEELQEALLGIGWIAPKER